MGLIEDVGRRIAELRRARGWTQEDLAVKMGLTVRRLRRFETEGSNLTLRTLERVAKGLGVPVGALFEPPRSRAPSPRGRPRKAPPLVAVYAAGPSPRDAPALMNPVTRPRRRKAAK